MERRVKTINLVQRKTPRGLELMEGCFTRVLIPAVTFLCELPMSSSQKKTPGYGSICDLAKVNLAANQILCPAFKTLFFCFPILSTIP
jgi:hypothetical protein